MLIDGKNWALHRPWFYACLVASVLAGVWYFASYVPPNWPGGSSKAGFTFGILGGLICIFEMLLWWRKKVRTWRIGRTQVWLRAHIWLGLLSVPLLVFHSGFRFGGTLSTVLMSLFLIVIVSGVWGLALQQYLPSKMLHDVPSETIFSQIDNLSGQVLRDAERLVRATCGTLVEEEGPTGVEEQQEPGAYLTIGAIRSAGQVQGKVLQTRVPAAPVEGAEALQYFFDQSVAPYLQEGAASGSLLAQANRSAVIFEEIKTHVPPEAHEAVDALAGWCEQRRQLDLQARIHFWLHNWLWVHLPLAVALIVLMFVHTWVAIQYW